MTTSACARCSKTNERIHNIASPWCADCTRAILPLLDDIGAWEETVTEDVSDEQYFAGIQALVDAYNEKSGTNYTISDVLLVEFWRIHDENVQSAQGEFQDELPA